MFGSNYLPIGSNSSISKLFKTYTSFFWASTMPRINGSLESGYCLTASFLHLLMQSAASKSYLASLVIEYFLLSSTYLKVVKKLLFGPDFDSFEFFFLLFDVFDKFEFLLFDLLSVLFEVLALFGHFLELHLVGSHFLFLLLYFFLSHRQALFCFKFN